jgi:hypothetical protein
MTMDGYNRIALGNRKASVTSRNRYTHRPSHYQLDGGYVSRT